MINTQLIYFKNYLVANTFTMAESIGEVFTVPQLLPIIGAITAIAILLFGMYKCAIYLGYFSSNRGVIGNQDPSPPPLSSFAKEDELFEVPFRLHPNVGVTPTILSEIEKIPPLNRPNLEYITAEAENIFKQCREHLKEFKNAN